MARTSRRALAGIAGGLLAAFALPAAAAQVGSFLVSDGPEGESDPPTYSCLEACALLFGGATGDYFCSTSDSAIDHQAFVDGLSDAQFCTTPAAEDFKAGASYACATPGCSYSAYVLDHACNVTNYCWDSFCGNGALDFGEECDDGNVANGDCCSSACLYDDPGTSCEDADVCNGQELCDGSGACVDGKAPDCDDGDPCTQDACEPGSGCTAATAPAPVCDASAGKASLLLDRKKQKASFAWQKGDVGFALLGTPTALDGFTLCVYDGASALVRRFEAPGGGTCGSKPCWKALGKDAAPSGFAYKDKAGAADAIRSLSAKSGAGKGALVLKAKGDALADLDLGAAGLASPVTAQLSSDAGGCWEASFGAADQQKNDADRFRAKRKGAAP